VAKLASGDPLNIHGIIDRYCQDIFLTMSEVVRVLRRGGTATFVVGNSCIRGAYVCNAEASDVENSFREGKIREIAAYCENDVVSTYRVWLRHELFRGAINQSKYEESERCLKAFLDCRDRRGGLSASSEILLIEIPVAIAPGEGGSHG
jgi:predicted PolB exonuclease-like 3'-5' exonuclease